MLQDPGIQNHVAGDTSKELSDFGDLSWREDKGKSESDARESTQSIAEEVLLVEDVSVWESPKRRRFGRSR